MSEAAVAENYVHVVDPDRAESEYKVSVKSVEANVVGAKVVDPQTGKSLGNATVTSSIVKPPELCPFPSCEGSALDLPPNQRTGLCKLHDNQIKTYAIQHPATKKPIKHYRKAQRDLSQALAWAMKDWAARNKVPVNNLQGV